MADEQEKTYGAVVGSDCGSGGDCGSGAVSLLGSVRKVIDTPADELPDEAITAAVKTLANGAVACSLIFIVLSFIYPDRATTVLGVLAPLLTVAQLAKEKLKERKNNGS